MCGGCRQRSSKDWTWPWVSDPRSVALIASAAERGSNITGIRVTPSGSGWRVSLPTGATHLPESVDALVRVARVDPEMGMIAVRVTAVPVLLNDHRRPVSPVARATIGRASVSIDSESWASELVNDPRIREIIVADDSPPRTGDGLRRFAGEVASAPLNEHVRIQPFGETVLGEQRGAWSGLPARISWFGLPGLCVALASRLAALEPGDTTVREFRGRVLPAGHVVVQSIGATVVSTTVTAG